MLFSSKRSNDSKESLSTVLSSFREKTHSTFHPITPTWSSDH